MLNLNKTGGGTTLNRGGIHASMISDLGYILQGVSVD